MKTIAKMMMLACVALPASALAQKAAPIRAVDPATVTAPVPQLPPAEAMVILIRSTVVALSQANMTNNYSVLSGLGSDNFRISNPPMQLAQAFSAFRTNRIDMNPVVYLTPQLTRAPAIEQGKMRLVGYFPSQPMQVNFDLAFEPSQGSWKLAGMGVNLSQAVAQASPKPVQR